MQSKVLLKQEFKIQGGDFVNAGESSCKVRNTLREIGIESDLVRRIAIAAYEAEMNIVMYAHHGTMRVNVYRDKILLTIDDTGPGIEDIDQAMQPGFSTATEEMREMGFGAGMGLPNMKKNADVFKITSRVGKGTKIEIKIFLNGNNG
jgi:serine/threonine-protein kinase RsbT